MPNQATASDHKFYDMFVPQKVPLSKISDDVIVCHFWFDPPQSKVLATPVHGEGAFWAVPPQIIACASQARVNFCTSTRGPANFSQKQVTTNAFLL